MKKDKTNEQIIQNAILDWKDARVKQNPTYQLRDMTKGYFGDREMKRKYPTKKKKVKMKRKHPSVTVHETDTKIVSSAEPNIQEIPKTKKTFADRIIIRKDGKPNCFVCQKPLDLLRELNVMKEEVDYGNKQERDALKKLSMKVNNTIVMLPNKNRRLYRHADCEHGSTKYLKNKALKKYSEKIRKEMS